jgi:hypothetical protein
MPPPPVDERRRQCRETKIGSEDIHGRCGELCRQDGGGQVLARGNAHFAPLCLKKGRFSQAIEKHHNF